jgi:MFS family permease
VLFSLFEIVVMLLWGFYLFQTYPIYKCTTTDAAGTVSAPFTCEPKEFCGKENISYEIDFSDNRSLLNWVDSLDLVCQPKWMLGMQGSSYFIGFVISSFTFLPLSDVIGRKPTLIIAFLMHLVFLVFALFLNGIGHYWIFNFLLFVTGSAAAGYFLVGFYFNVEGVPEVYAVTVGSSLRAINSLSPLIAAFFFLFISQDWKQL